MATKRSFKTKLILSYVLVTIIPIGLIAFFLDRNLEDKSIHEIESSLVSRALLIEDQISAQSLKDGDVAVLDALAKRLGPKAKCRVTIIDRQGKVLADSEKPRKNAQEMENHLNRPEVRAAADGNTGLNMRYSETLKMDMLYAALPIRDKSAVIGIIRVAIPLGYVRNILLNIRKTVSVGAIFAIILAFILGTIVAGKTMRPVNRMIYASRKFSEGDFSRRVAPGVDDEIGELADTFNKMAGDIENKIGQIRTQNQKLEGLFNSMAEGVIVIDRGRRLVSVNPTIERIFGISKKDIQGKIFLDAIRNNDIAKIVEDVLSKGKAVSIDLELVYPVRGAFEMNAVPIFDGDKMGGCLAVIHDITEIKRLETVRKDFIANISHELKTPLTSIKGFVETLLDGGLDDRENNYQFLKIIQEHANRLDGLVSDLLILSHLESKEIALEKRPFDLKELTDGLIQGFKSQLMKKNIRISNELPAGLRVTADRSKIDQVMTNLIDNAIKFNKESGLVRIFGDFSRGNTKIFIEDSGTGIPERDIPRIFERFYRVDKARSRDLGGTGLGLSIVKHIVELHGGTVGVESAEGLGSKFWFILPE